MIRMLASRARMTAHAVTAARPASASLSAASAFGRPSNASLDGAAAANFLRPPSLPSKFGVGVLAIRYSAPNQPSLALDDGGRAGVRASLRLRSGSPAYGRRRAATRDAQYRRVTGMVLKLVGFYLVCWLPYWLSHSIRAFVPISFGSYTRIFYRYIHHVAIWPGHGSNQHSFSSILHLLPYLNCAVNPFLFAILTKNFRHENLCGTVSPVYPLLLPCLSRPRPTLGELFSS